MQYKDFVACIYLENQKAVKSFEDRTVISTDTLTLCEYYNEQGFDGIIVYDMSVADKAHEEAVSMIRKICETSQIPIYGAGNITRLEDVKKLIYAGCQKVILNYGKYGCQELLREASLRFGRDKLAVSIASADNLTISREMIETYASGLVLMDEHALKNCLGMCDLPIITMIPDVSLSKIFTILEMYHVAGVSGNIVNQNAKEIFALKQLCKERGLPVRVFEPVMEFSEFKLDANGLIPVVVQDYITDQVLMVAYMNEEAYIKTLRTGKMTYYSRSRKQLWVKGLTSGHFQYVMGLRVDCDNDTLLARVKQVGAACHTGNYSCFYRDLIPSEQPETDVRGVLESVYDVIRDRKKNPKEGSCATDLFDKGLDKILKKVGEEAAGMVIAAKNPDTEELKYEISDFLYLCMVLMAEKNLTWEEIMRELANRG